MKNITKILGWISLPLLLLSLCTLIIFPDKTKIAYVAGIAGLTLIILFAAFNMETVREIILRRQARYGMHSGIMIIIVLSILILINTIAVRHKERFDLTEEGSFTISKQTKQVLRNLKNDIKITGFFQTESMNRGKFKDLLESYAHESKKITYELIDPDKNPSITKRYGITNYEMSVLESGKQETKIRDISEEALTNAIIKVTKAEKKRVYFLTGHNEHSIDNQEKDGYSEAKTALEGEGFEVKNLLLIQEGAIPEDASLLVIDGPEKALMEAEKKAIGSYLQKGGSALIMIDPNTVNGLASFLKERGVIAGDNIIIDTVSKIFGGDFTVPVVTEYTEHDITKDFTIPTFFPLVRSVEPSANSIDNILVEPLIKTGESSWGETDTRSRKVKFDKDIDKPGPVTIGVVVTKEELTDTEQTEEIEKGDGKNVPKTKKYTMVVVGDSDFASNYYFHFSGNGDLFLNMVSWLTREENFITIRPKKRQFAPISITNAQGSFIFLFSLLLIPSVVLISGGAKWWKRRKL